MSSPVKALRGNVGRVAMARFVSRAGGEAAFFVGIWGKSTYELDSTPGQLALLMGVMGVMALLGSAIGGVLVDRYDPKRVLLYGEIAFVPAALAPILASTMSEMTLSIAFLALVSMVVYTAVASFPPYLTAEEDELKGVNAVIETAGNAAFVAGPALGALLVRFGDVDHIFVLDAVTSLVGAVFILSVHIRPMPKESNGEAKPSAFREMKEGFGIAYSSKALRLFILTSTFTWLAFGAFGSVEPLFYRDVLEVGPETLGWVNTIFGLGLIAGSVVLARLPKRYMTATSVVALTSLSGLGGVLYASTADLRIVVLGAILWGMVLGMVFPMSRTLTQVATPEGMYGRVTAAINLHAHVGELFPLTFVPALAAALGVQAVLVGAGGVLFLLSLTRYRAAFVVDREVMPAVAERDDLETHLEPSDEPVSPVV